MIDQAFIHDLFLLMLNLYQLRAPDLIIERFLEAVNHRLGNVRLRVLNECEEAPAGTTTYSIAASSRKYGRLALEGDTGLLSATDQAVLRNTISMLAVIMENTDQSRQLERARDRALDQRNRFFNLSAALLCVAGFDGIFKIVNPAFETVLGWSPDELRNKPFMDYIHPDDGKQAMDAVQTLTAGTTLTGFEARMRSKDGSYRLLSWSSQPVLEEQLIYAAARDVTEERAMQARNLQSQKMESIGRLAGGVAHDFNNMLGGILGYADLILSKVDDESPINGYAESIALAAEQAADLTRKLLAFGRKATVRHIPLDVHRLIHETAAILKRTTDRNIRIELQLDAAHYIVEGDAAHLQSVLINLGLNARDAMPAGGVLRFTTENVAGENGSEADEERCNLRIAVSDTGVGMTEDARRHAFEPFFTTKDLGKGTGLGLAAVYGTIKEHGGNIDIHSKKGDGTTVLITLPATNETAEHKPRLRHHPASNQGTILLADDEEVVRNAVTDMLEGMGYSVIPVADGKQAVETFRERKDEIDLCILDVVMPEMNGRDCFLRIRELNPGARILVSSGHTRDSSFADVKGQVDFIQKPFHWSALEEAVQQAIES